MPVAGEIAEVGERVGAGNVPQLVMDVVLDDDGEDEPRVRLMMNQPVRHQDPFADLGNSLPVRCAGVGPHELEAAERVGGAEVERL